MHFIFEIYLKTVNFYLITINSVFETRFQLLRDRELLWFLLDIMNKTKSLRLQLNAKNKWLEQNCEAP